MTNEQMKQSAEAAAKEVVGYNNPTNSPWPMEQLSKAAAAISRHFAPLCEQSAADITPNSAALKRLARKHPAGEYEAGPEDDTAKDAEIARLRVEVANLRANAVQECRKWKDALVTADMENLREQVARLESEREAAIDRLNTEGQRLSDERDAALARIAKLEAALEGLKHADGCHCEAAFSMGDGTHPRHSDECKAACAALDAAKEAK